MSDLLACPYCHASQDDPDDCYAPETPYEHSCHDCGKNFIFYIEYDPDYQAKKADCLNGSEHDFEESSTIPKKFTRLICSGCHKEKPVSAERRAELIKEDEAACAKAVLGYIPWGPHPDA